MRRLTVLLLVLLVTLTAALPAGADKPEYWYDQDYVWEFPAVDCTYYGLDFWAVIRTEGHESELPYYDKSGTLLRTLYQSSGLNTVYNSAHPENRVSAAFNYSIHKEMTGATTWIGRYTGKVWNIQVPGYGPVIHVSGQIVQEVDNWDVIREIRHMGLSAYPNNPAARKAIKAQAKCRKAA
jgi:hypothetical protein